MADPLISTALHHRLPENYVRPETQRPLLDEVVPDADIPVVDVANPDHAAVVAQIGEACRTHGFFQVLNHGVPVERILETLAVAYEFFQMPAEEKAKLYSDDPAKKTRLSTSFNVRKETVHNWRDYLRLHCHPLEQYVPDWPANPSSFREIVSSYCREVRELGFRLYGAISESLGLEEEYIRKVLGEQEQHMAVNFYPKCPAPALTYGLPAHTDPNALTILLMDQQVAGLQVLKEGRWIAVNPRPNALVINIGDQLQALSNGRYKSVWHRAVVNSDRPRLSVASFLCPCNDVLLGPAAELISEDSPAVYRDYTYAEEEASVSSSRTGKRARLEEEASASPSGACAGVIVSHAAVAPPVVLDVKHRPINAIPPRQPPPAARQLPPSPAAREVPPCVREHFASALGLRPDLPVHFIAEKVVTSTDVDARKNRFLISVDGVERLRLILTPVELDAANLLHDAAAEAGTEQGKKIKEPKKGKVHGGLRVKLVDLAAGAKELQMSRWNSNRATVVKGEGYNNFIRRCSLRKDDAVEVWAFVQRPVRIFGVDMMYGNTALHMVIVKKHQPPLHCCYCGQ